MGAPSLLPSALGTRGRDTPLSPLSLPRARISGPGCSGQGRATRSGGWLPAQAMIWGTGRAAVPPHPDRRRAENLCVCCRGLGGAPRLERLLQWAQAPAEWHRDKAGVGSTQASSHPGAPQPWQCLPAPHLHGSSPQHPLQVVTRGPSCHTSLSKPALKVSWRPNPGLATLLGECSNQYNLVSGAHGITTCPTSG